ncbi:MAG: DUF1501 domain-containing protein [Actinomycetota bacterium]
MTTLSRRTFLAGSGTVATFGLVTSFGTSLTLAAPGVPSDGDVLVVLFLNGGADGLALTPPLRDPAYYDLRPRLGIPQPGQANGSLPLRNNGKVRFSSGFDGAFGLHPAAKPLYDGLWADGKLAFIPAAGFKDTTFSHFTAVQNGQRGSLSLGVGGGWLGRMTNAQGGPGPVPSVSRGRGTLAGGTGTMGVIPSLGMFKGGVFNGPRKDALLASYAGGDSVSATGRRLLNLADRFAELEHGLRDGYTDHKLRNRSHGYGLSFSELASLLKADPPLGIRAAGIELGRWDHHEALGLPGDTQGNFHSLVTAMSDAIQRFAEETNGLQGITLVVTSEFGRTSNENGNLGTDHGEGYTMMVAGAGIRGGVYGDDFPDSIALPPGARRGTLPIATDYRKPITEVIRKRVKLANTSSVFPDFTQSGSDLGIA